MARIKNSVSKVKFEWHLETARREARHIGRYCNYGSLRLMVLKSAQGGAIWHWFVESKTTIVGQGWKKGVFSAKESAERAALQHLRSLERESVKPLPGYRLLQEPRCCGTCNSAHYKEFGMECVWHLSLVSEEEDKPVFDGEGEEVDFFGQCKNYARGTPYGE